MSPWDCLPEHINEPHEWDGYDDDDHFYTRWRKKVKGWFAIGNAANRSKHKWANWRELPITLFVTHGVGSLRFESTDGSFDIVMPSTKRTWWYEVPNSDLYLSRVQYWCGWHIALEWPLFLHGHYGNWQAYIGCKRDADKVYWLSVYLGRCWK